MGATIPVVNTVVQLRLLVTDPQEPCSVALGNCGHDIRIGDWPTWPHGKADPNNLRPFVAYFDEHISEKGEWISSLGDRKRLMKINNMDYHGRKIGHPGCEV